MSSIFFDGETLGQLIFAVGVLCCLPLQPDVCAALPQDSSAQASAAANAVASGNGAGASAAATAAAQVFASE